jgi:molecular chaperone HtpG
VVEVMNAAMEKDGRNPLLQEYTDLLYNEALLLEGSKPKDPAAFTKVISRLMLENMKRTGE